MLLQDANIKLRALEPEDMDILYYWENDTTLWRYGRSVSPYSKLALRQYIGDSLEMDIFQSRQLRLMVELIGSDVTIGTVDLYDIDQRNGHVGIGILIDKSFRRRNYALSVLSLVSSYVFSFLKLHQIYAYIGIENQASLGLFQKAGYVEAGILHDWILSPSLTNDYEDVYVMQLINSRKSNDE